MYVNYAKLVIQRDRPLNRGGEEEGCLYDETFFLPFALNGPSFSAAAEDEARFQTS